MKTSPRVVYEFSRLGFKRDQIEQLSINERFRVVTPGGTFEMTRGDFERVFANVARSQSYRLRGLYHYPVTPAKADPFRIDCASTEGRSRRAEIVPVDSAVRLPLRRSHPRMSLRVFGLANWGS
jgi:hypothetical protein